MSAYADEQLLRASLLACLSGFLTTELLPSTRPPVARWRVSLRRDLTTGPITTGRLFFESGGAQAWTAYEAVRPTTISCQGQADRRRCFVDLDRQSVEFKADIARMVGTTVVPHPTVADLIAPIAQEALSLLGRPGDAEVSIEVASSSALSKRRRRSSRFVVAAGTRAEYENQVSTPANAPKNHLAVQGRSFYLPQDRSQPVTTNIPCRPPVLMIIPRWQPEDGPETQQRWMNI